MILASKAGQPCIFFGRALAINHYRMRNLSQVILNCDNTSERRFHGLPASLAFIFLADITIYFFVPNALLDVILIKTPTSDVLPGALIHIYHLNVSGYWIVRVHLPSFSTG
jgi:hypothetical protein